MFCPVLACFLLRILQVCAFPFTTFQNATGLLHVLQRCRQNHLIPHPKHKVSFTSNDVIKLQQTLSCWNGAQALLYNLIATLCRCIFLLCSGMDKQQCNCTCTCVLSPLTSCISHNHLAAGQEAFGAAWAAQCAHPGCAVCAPAAGGVCQQAVLTQLWLCNSGCAWR